MAPKTVEPRPVPREKISEASAVWNIFYAAGTGLGSTVLGALVAGSGYSGAVGVGAAIIAGGHLLSVVGAATMAPKTVEPRPVPAS